MLDFKRINPFSTKYDDHIACGFIYEFEHGEKEDFDLILIREDGMIQICLFTVEEVSRLYPEGFNFRRINHPAATESAFEMLNYGFLPMATEFTSPIPNLQRKDPEIIKKVKEELSSEKSEEKKEDEGCEHCGQNHPDSLHDLLEIFSKTIKR